MATIGWEELWHSSTENCDPFHLHVQQRLLWDNTTEETVLLTLLYNHIPVIFTGNLMQHVPRSVSDSAQIMDVFEYLYHYAPGINKFVLKMTVVSLEF